MTITAVTVDSAEPVIVSAVPPRAVPWFGDTAVTNGVTPRLYTRLVAAVATVGALLL